MRLLVVLLLATRAFAQTSDYIEVTATKIDEDLIAVPSSITVITGEDLRRSGARDLASALARVAGVAIARGGDAGPAGVVPEMWGLREADAFLLIVDGVPWGGAFNPPTEAIDLNDVERIEVVRGSAPVVYGATAFSGVIHVIHRGGHSGTASVGSYGSGSIDASTNGFSASFARERFRDDDAGFDRGRVAYHARRGAWRFDADLLRLEQSPASPHPREGRALSTRVPIDTNFNPRDAHLDETRLHLGGVYQSPRWTTTFAISRTDGDVLRGFLADLDTGAATGFEQSREITDLYVDTRTVRTIGALRVVAGVDYTGGIANADSDTFAYSTTRSGETATGTAELEDRRNFAAVYAQGEWTPFPAWRVDAGARMNHARESRDDESRTTTRGSGFLGISRRIAGETWAFADYRDTFKPALLGFSPLDDEGILEPETSRSVEVGVKSRTQHLFWQASAFTMDLQNLVIANRNSGEQRFKGVETEVSYTPTDALRLFASWAFHDARFRDYVQSFDGVPTQLRGRRFEMSPRTLASAGATFSRGAWTGSIAASHTGSRFLNKRNTALAEAFTTVDAGVGYRALRVDVTNLTNRRDPVAESELGDAQYYLVPARAVRVTYSRSF